MVKAGVTRTIGEAARGGRRSQSIAVRWFVKCFGVVVALLVVLVAVCYFGFRNYYYYSVEQYLWGELNKMSGVLMFEYDEGRATPDSMYRVIEEFDKKRQMELMAISDSGKAVIASSGFSPDSEANATGYMSDVSAAFEKDGRARYTGYTDLGEKYMAVTLVLPKTLGVLRGGAGGFGAIRAVTSLEHIDDEIALITVLAFAGSVLVLVIVLCMGMYFVRSIVKPLAQFDDAAWRLSSGDYSVRLPETGRDDEISQLCDVLNHLARELESAEEIKNEFISSISHELRTPLTAIKGWAETISESMPDTVSDNTVIYEAGLPEQRRIFKSGMKIIVSETERLSGMVEELLDFSRMNSGQLVLRREVMDVIAELSDAVLIYNERARRDLANIIYNEPDGAALIDGDKNRIKQVFINIIDNALKYCKNSITVTAAIGDTEVVVVIKDDGAGIPADDLPKIKTRFFKAENSVRGSGIGLAVADELIMLHGGTLDIDSELGIGTTVRICLPLID